MATEVATVRLPGYLAGLKRRGGRILVVGTGGHEPICRRLQGADDANRHRVLVSPSETEPENVPTGGVPVPETGQPSRPRDHDGGVRLSRLARDALAEIDRLASGGLDAAQLRVCVPSIDELLAETDLDRTALFLDAVLDRTRTASGIAHVHLERDYRSDPVQRLEPRFDAVIEVRESPAAAQRWHFPDRDRVTPWVPIGD